jgi:hypothetical protein
MASEYYEVMYNMTYGGFSFPMEFVKHVFEKYPPHTPVGTHIWQKHGIKVLKPGETPDKVWQVYYEIVKCEPFAQGYNYVFLKQYIKDTKSGEFKAYRTTNKFVSANNIDFYILTEYELGWRDDPDVIALAKEFGLFERKNDDSTLTLKQIPVGYNYDIDEYDGKETIVVIFPYRQVISELVIALRSGDNSGLGSLSKQLLEGTLNPDTI